MSVQLVDQDLISVFLAFETRAGSRSHASGGVIDLFVVFRTREPQDRFIKVR